MMRIVATGKQGKGTGRKRTTPEVVKWISLFVILLAMTVNTFGEELPLPIARASPSQASLSVKPPCPLVSNGNPAPFNGICYYIPTRGTCMNGYKLIPTTKVCTIQSQYANNTHNFQFANGPCPLVSNGNPVPFNGICYYIPTSGTCMKGYKLILVIKTCSEPVITPTTSIPSPSGTTGQRATSGQCPAGPAGALVSYDPKIQQCYYPLPTGTCKTGFNSQTVGPTTFCEIPPLTGIPSPSGTTGQPATDGQCPPGPVDTLVDYDPKIQQCFYLLPTGATCQTTGYTSQTVGSATYCEAPPPTGILSPSGKTGQPATTGQCPPGLPTVFVDYDPKIQQCYYLSRPGTLCVQRYKLQTIYCLAPPLTGILSPSGKTGQPVTAGQCPPSPLGILLDYDPQIQQCYYLLSTGGTCPTGFNSQAVGPATYCEVSPLTGIRSPSGNTGQPAPTGLCPPGPPSPPSVSVDFDPKIQQCYYPLPPGITTCQASYNLHTGFCQAPPLSPSGNPGQLATNGQCSLAPVGITPDFDPKALQCYYLLPPGGVPPCLAGYKSTVGTIMYCQGLPLSPSHNPGLPAPDGLCPAGPADVPLGFDPKAQQCYYILSPGNATCQTPDYSLQTVAQTMFCKSSPKSPAGNSGLPDTTGLCPPGPAGIPASFDPKAKQCYYLLPAGVPTCKTGYKSQTVGTIMYCQGLPLSPAHNPGLPAPDGLCPPGPAGITLGFDPKALQCYSLVSPEDVPPCLTNYKSQVVAQNTFCVSVPQSPSGNPGLPDTAGLCPPSPVGTTPDFDPKAQQCYYIQLSPAGATPPCLASYSSQTVATIMYCQGPPLSPAHNPGLPAPASQCPLGPAGIPINFDTKAQQCYYILSPGNATCQNGYKSQVVATTTFCVSTPQSPAGNPSLPDTTGQCPAPPTGITADFDAKAPQNQQCFYPLPDGATTCATSYTLQGNFCEAATIASTVSPSGNPTQPAANGQCPPGPSGVTVNFDNTAQQCSYILAPGATCLGTYTQQTVGQTNFCVSPPTGVTTPPNTDPNNPTNNNNQCPKGGQTNNNSCTYNANNGKCDDGSKPDNNNKCTFTFNNTTCPANGSVNDANMCTYPTDSKGNCPSGGTANGNTCSFPLDLSKCPKGGNVDNNVCTYKDNTNKCLSGGTSDGNGNCTFTLNSTDPNSPGTNQCPPVKGQAITDNGDGTCTYSLPAGATTCTKPYTNTNPSDPCTYTLPCSTVTGHTPTIQGTVCKYTPNAGEQCATGYGLVNGQCISNANTNSLNSSPPNVCPPKYKPNHFGSCSLPGAIDGAGTIDATCQTGYFSYNNNCVPNSDAYLIDPTTGPCTLTPADATNFPAPSYSCPYGNGGMLLNCRITTASTKEDCYVMKTFPGVASYECLGFNMDNQIPANGCTYDILCSAKCDWLKIGSSTCKAGSSTMVDCQIQTCIDVKTGGLEPCSPKTTFPPSFNIIVVNIHQSCTQMKPGTALTCIYGDGTAATTATTTKTVELSKNCSPASPPASITCFVTDPYGRVIEKHCQSQADQNAQYTCFIYDYTSDNSLSTPIWEEKCQQITAPLPTCSITDKSGNNPLGTLACNLSYTCTIKDQSQHTMTLKCPHTASTYNCTSMTPDCPHTDLSFPTYTSSTAPVTEATIACDGNLVVDLLMFDKNDSSTINITYPLSQGELEYALLHLVIGTQTWIPPLQVTYL